MGYCRNFIVYVKEICYYFHKDGEESAPYEDVWTISSAGYWKRDYGIYKKGAGAGNESHRSSKIM